MTVWGIGVLYYSDLAMVFLVRSPVLHINRTCQTCHKWLEEERNARIETIQQRTDTLCHVAMDTLMDVIEALKVAQAAGKANGGLMDMQNFQRQAQFYVDFVEAENPTGAPQISIVDGERQ